MADVEFFGETFPLNPDINPFALLEFAEAAADGQDGETLEGLASVLRLALECIAEPEPVEGVEVQSQRARFRAVARRNRANVTDLVPVIRAVLSGETERPTGRPSDSSDGPPSIEPKSESSTSGKVAELFPGRPDLQLAVLRTTQEAPEAATA